MPILGPDNMYIELWKAIGPECKVEPGLEVYPENPFHVWFILVYRYSPSTSEYFREKALCGQKIYLCQAVVTCFYVGSVRCILISRYIEMHFCLCWHVGQSDIQCCAGP